MQTTLVAFLLCMLPLFAQSQAITVTGTVTEKYEKVPLPFVSIYINRNTDTLVYSDEDGRYSIQVNPTDLLTFYFLGYNIFETRVDGRSVIDVEMDCEDCGRDLYDTKGMRNPSHDLSVMSAYGFNQWGYAVSYAYLPRIDRSHNVFNILLRNAQPSVRIQNLTAVGSDIRIYPYLKVPVPISVPLFTKKQKLYLFATVGYYFDTDFKKVQQHDWGLGGGFSTRLAFIYFKGSLSRYMTVNLTAGYTAFTGAEKMDNVYMGLRFYLGRAFIFE